jgi:hypothetical protein
MKSGVPQRRMIFSNYGADLADLGKFSSVFKYADETISSVADMDKEKVIGNLDKDEVNILKSMASNGLVANLVKTDFMVMNSNKGKKKQEKIQF